MSEHKCKRCNRILKSEESIKRGYGAKCYKIIQFQESKPEQSNIEELLNRIRKLELDNNFIKHQLKHKTIVTKHPDEDLDWDIKPEIKKIKNEYKIEFNVIIKELKVIFKNNKPLLEKGTRFGDEVLGVKDLEVQPQIKEINYLDLLKPVNPIEEPVSPPMMAIV